MRFAILMVLHPSVAQAFVDLLNDVRQALPSKASISRWRLLLDGAMMQVTREINAERHANGLGSVLSLMVRVHYLGDM